MSDELIRIANTDSRYRVGFNTILLSGVAAAVIYAGYCVNNLVATADSPFNQAVLLIAGFIALVALACGVASDIRFQTKEAYKDRLYRLEKKILIKYFHSPELYSDEQRLVLEVLNKWHPGWSMDED